MPAMIETDYLVVGAGASGMAFTDALLTRTDATVTIVDRRAAPGGHWRDAYAHVRLHQPSAFYGVDSVPLGQDAIDAIGTNAGFYELAGADELRAYFEHVMHRHFLPTGRVRYFPSSEYVGEHRFVSRLTGASEQVRVRRKLVDTTYLEGTIPATSPPPFTVAEGVRCIPAGDIDCLDRSAERFVVIGGGKTALDTCVCLLERGVAASAIRWIRPRECWWMNRKFQQPRTLVPDLYLGAAIQIEAMAQARSVDELFAKLEAEGIFIRLDPSLEPTMFRGAIVSEAEMQLLRQITDVVRMGHVRSIERHEIVLEHGRIPTNDETVHVHCAARGLVRRPLRPIFEPGRVTIQPIFWGFACYQFATLGMIEAVIESDEEKNRLCQPIPYWEENDDYLSSFLATMVGNRLRASHPIIAEWAQTSRLNPVAGVAGYRSDPRVVEASERIKRNGAAAVTNLQKLLAVGA
jgi:hypothetical protein